MVKYGLPGAVSMTMLFSALAVDGLAAQEPAMDGHAHHGHAHHNMTFDSSGMVMNSNTDRLPRDCETVTRDYKLTVHAGTEFAARRPGTIFGFSDQEFSVEPCSRVTVTFVNEDEIRHQWMVHGLPKYLYNGGMFHLEAAGGHSQTGSFIVPSDNKTYLIHCDIAQHMEMGMKAQLKVGRGSGDLWSIPEVSGDLNRDNYLPGASPWLLLLATIAGVVLPTFLVWRKRV